MLPKISILITSYNREKYIDECLESVIKFNYTNSEIIIVDDCSSDNTYIQIKKFAESDNRLKIYRNKINLGQFKNRNLAASYASGEYLIFVDSDDTLLSEKLSLWIDILIENPKIDFAICKNSIQNEKYRILSSKNALIEHFFSSPFLIVGPGATVIKTKLFKSVGGFPIIYGAAGDMFYNLIAASNGIVSIINFNYANYRRHDGQEINNSFDYLWGNFKYLNDFLNNNLSLLSSKEIKWIASKNKRRFIINIFSYFLKSRSIKSTAEAWKKAEFNFYYLFQGIFHLN